MMVTKAFLVTGLALLQLTGAQKLSEAQCEAQYDSLSSKCCGSGGDIFECAPKTCPAACVTALPTYMKGCGTIMGLTASTTIKTLMSKCKTAATGGKPMAGYKQQNKHTCAYDYSKGHFKTQQLAEAACNKLGETCAGVYASSCMKPSTYTSWYLCSLGYMTVSTSKYGSQCVMQKASIPLVAAPKSACSPSPCKNGAKCTASISKDYTRGSETYGTYISKARCVCTKGWLNTLCDQKAPVDGCLASPCKNGATCRSYNSKNYTTSKYYSRVSCSCPRFKKGDTTIVGGKNCHTVFDNPCMSDGSDDGSDDPSSSRRLQSMCGGFAGAQCPSGMTCKYPAGSTAGTCVGPDDGADDTAADGPCLNGATCRPYASTYSEVAKAQCSCTPSWTGTTCSTKRVNYCDSTVRSSSACPSAGCTDKQCVMKEDGKCGQHCETMANNKAQSCSAAQTQAGKAWKSCGTKCPLTCGGSSMGCIMMCVQGCFCKSSMYYDPKNNKCVPKAECTIAPKPMMMDGGMMDGMMMDGGMRGGIAIGRPFTTAACDSLTAAAVAGDAADDSWSR